MPAPLEEAPGLGPCVMGIDEAGRGPVLGPMVIAAVVIPEDRLEALEDLGVDDSKRLSKKKREALVDPIMSLACEVRIVELSPLIIDGAVLDGSGLDRLEARTAARLIRETAADSDLKTAYVDAVGPGGVLHRKRIAEKLGDAAPELVVENKADANYAVVAAASILAKVTRDKRIAALTSHHGDLGSGYPSDAKTKAAVARMVRQHVRDGEPLPDYLRCSWATVTNAMTAFRQGELF